MMRSWEKEASRERERDERKCSRRGLAKSKLFVTYVTNAGV